MAAIGHRLQRRNSMKCEEEKEPVHLEKLSILNRNWEYRGEGNANIVIALQDEMRVVRLSKSNIGEHIGGIKASYRRKIEREVQFANFCFGPLLGLEFIEKVRAIRFSLTEIESINQCLKNIRPDFRLHKELKIPFATLHSDYAMISSNMSNNTNFCIEIKPKQGWWPKTSDTERSPYCTYCLNQFLKLNMRKITKMTKYCPLDLFSGDAERMILSVAALIKNPQNNLRVFRNGKLVYGDGIDESIESVIKDMMVFNCDSNNESAKANIDYEKSKSLNNLIYLICLALIKPKKPVIGRKLENELFLRLKSQLKRLLLHSSAIDYNEQVAFDVSHCNENLDGITEECQIDEDILSAEMKKRECERRGKFLPPGSILSRILFIQKLGQRGISSIYELFRKICPVHEGFQVSDSDHINGRKVNQVGHKINGTIEYSTSDDEEKQEFTCPGVDCLAAPEKWLDGISDLGLDLDDTEMQSLEHYLLAATAKDCSIMLTFSPSMTSDSNNLEDRGYLTLRDLNGGLFLVRIGVADLDPKPVNTIVRHFIRDDQMSKSYENYRQKKLPSQ